MPTTGTRRVERRQSIAVTGHAPDGGYGWIITFSGFMVGFLLDGICLCTGVFYNDFLEYFGESNFKTAIYGSVINGMYLTTGPIASACCNRFGCRCVGICGSIFTASALLASAFSPTLDVLILTFGFLAGIGFGFMYIPALLMVSIYFSRRQCTAIGIAVCGSGVGGFAFAPLIVALIEIYAWQGAMIILSAVILNGAVVSALLRPLQCDTGAKSKLTNGEGITCIDDEAAKNGTSQHFASTNALPQVKKSQAHVFLSECDFGKTRTSTNGHTAPLRFSMQSLPYLTASMSAIYNGNMDCEEKNKENLDVTFRGRLQQFILRFCSFIDFTPLQNPCFALYEACCFLAMFGFFVPFAYTPPLVTRNKGMTASQGAWLVSAMGISNVVGRLFTGWITDKKRNLCILFNIVALIFCGVITIGIPMLSNFAALIGASVAFGLCVAVFISLRPIMTVEILSQYHVAEGFGLVTLAQGISAFLGLPIGGFLSDKSGNYYAAFYLAGSSLILAGLICLPMLFSPLKKYIDDARSINRAFYVNGCANK